ncbi:MAG: pyridoxal-phosphate dependent enzyme, partial [Acidobacteriota bacterium]
LGDFLVLDAIYKTDGCAVAVDDDQILAAEEMLASREGTFVCPEGAANLSAALELKDQGWIKRNDKVVLLNTGSGLKYPETVQVQPPVLEKDAILPSGFE